MIAECNVSPSSILLTLNVTDAECITELRAHETDQERFSLAALRVGILALRQAAGVIDHQAIRAEGDRLVEGLRSSLDSYYQTTTSEVSSILRQYFDVNDGSLPQRLERLVRKDGDLENLLSRYLNGNSSTLSQTLERHFGTDSPLLQTLSPDRSKGLVAAISAVLTETVEKQNKSILQLFSMDSEDSALSRVVRRLSDQNGELRQGITADVEKLRLEFSLDNPNGSLNRLIERVEKSREAIVREFSPQNEGSILYQIGQLLRDTRENIQHSLTLDNEESSLSRLKRELLGVVQDLQKENTAFHTEVREALAGLVARRQESKRSTTHGLEFHETVESFIEREALRAHDVCERTGSLAGKISRCKKGDAVVTLGPETQAPGARIVFEAKSDKSYTLKRAIDELQEAKVNREAQHGIFVFDRAAAPASIEPLFRYGDDIIVTWDPTDPTSDVILHAAYSIAHCIAVHTAKSREQKTGERIAIEQAIKSIEEKIQALNEIETLATTTRNNGQKIIDHATKLRGQIEKSIELVKENLGAA